MLGRSEDRSEEPELMHVGVVVPPNDFGSTPNKQPGPDMARSLLSLALALTRAWHACSFHSHTVTVLLLGYLIPHNVRRQVRQCFGQMDMLFTTRVAMLCSGRTISPVKTAHCVPFDDTIRTWLILKLSV